RRGRRATRSRLRGVRLRLDRHARCRDLRLGGDRGARHWAARRCSCSGVALRLERGRDPRARRAATARLPRAVRLMSGYLHRLVARARGEPSAVHSIARLRTAPPIAAEIAADAPAPGFGAFAGGFAGARAETVSDAGGASAPLQASVAETDSG